MLTENVNPSREMKKYGTQLKKKKRREEIPIEFTKYLLMTYCVSSTKNYGCLQKITKTRNVFLFKDLTEKCEHYQHLKAD